MVNLDEYKKLEDLGVYFHYSPEHYSNGSNLNFSIEFKNYDTQTGWYNDNHEFGDVYSTMTKSIQLAYWYLEDPKRIEMIDSGYHNPEYMSYQNEIAEVIQLITTVKEPFKHEFKVLTREEVMEGRSNAYDFIDFNEEDNYKELTYEERYDYWFSHNYETGMEYHPEIVPDFDNDYYDPTPKFKNK